jgi:hypothetical protein
MVSRESIEEGDPLSLSIKFSAVHEDISKNVRLGIEARIYDFVELYELDTGERPVFSLMQRCKTILLRGPII